MASETSAVLVAIRVRPFSSRESPLECTVTVPNSHTIVLTDVGTVSAGYNAGGSGQQHVFGFDKVFWSVPPPVLPISLSTMPPPTLSPLNLPIATPVSRSGSTAGACSSTASTVAGMSDSSVPYNSLPCFARVPEYDDQARLYDFIGQRMSGSVMRGFNSCLFAYGQTGSGKTHSMMGPPDGFTLQSSERGIMPRLCEDLFRMMHNEREEDESVTYNVECSFLEIYCERVRDLLNPNTNGVRDLMATYNGSFVNSSGALSSTLNMSGGALRVRQHPMRGPYVEGLSLVNVRDAAGVMRQLTSGLRERATAETRMNEHSSRSHAILQLLITRVALVREESGVVTKTRVCKVNMVDLAGSERISQSGATGDRFEEARNINLSLSTLGRVIQQLSEKQTGRNIVPAYRDSILTWLLSDSLGGNSKTIMLATIAPSAYCYQQTLNTLRFAGVTKKIVNVATVNEDRHFQKLITSLRQQIVKLTIQLEEGKASEVHLQQIESLRRERDDLDGRAGALLAQLREMVPAAEFASLQRRVEELEAANAILHKERTQLQRQLVSATTTLREELAASRSEIARLTGSLAQKNINNNNIKGAPDLARRCNEGITSPDPFAAPPPLPQSNHYTNHNHTVTRLQPQVSNMSSQSQYFQSQQSNRLNGSQLNSAATTPTSATPFVVAEVRRPRNVTSPTPSAKNSSTNTTIKNNTTPVSVTPVAAADRQRVAALKAELNAARADVAILRRSLEERSAALHAAQSDLAAARALLRTGTEGRDLSNNNSNGNGSGNGNNGNSETAQRERELSAQLDHVRAEYLREKQANVDLLLRMSRAEEAAQQRARDLQDRDRDVAELDLLLLEETETSERYYLRLRRQREAHAMHARLLLLLFMLSTKSHDTLSQESHESLCRRLQHAEDALETLRSERIALREEKAAAAGAALCAQREAEAQALEVARLIEVNDTLVARIVEAQPTARRSHHKKKRNNNNNSPDNDSTDNDNDNDSGSENDSDGSHESESGLAKCAAAHREEIGALRAQLEAERRARADETFSAQREREALIADASFARAERTASLRESVQIVKDHEQRVAELQALVAELRAEASSSSIAVEKKMEALRCELREAMASQLEIERRLRECGERAVEGNVYVSLERSALNGGRGGGGGGDYYYSSGDDDDAWMEAARREQERLERQKREARRLNEELLEMVRRRNESLREVDRQITKMQRGGVSPDSLEEEEDSNPLREQLHGDV